MPFDTLQVALPRPLPQPFDYRPPEGLAADEQGNIFAGLTGGCDKSPSGGCLQKWVRAR